MFGKVDTANNGHGSENVQRDKWQQKKKSCVKNICPVRDRDGIDLDKKKRLNEGYIWSS